MTHDIDGDVGLSALPSLHSLLELDEMFVYAFNQILNVIDLSFDRN